MIPTKEVQDVLSSVETSRLFEADGSAYLLMGYPLILSECERDILRAVLRVHPESVSASSLAEEFGSSEGQISVQIHRINQKAKSISGRKLIIGISHHGFRINPHM